MNVPTIPARAWNAVIAFLIKHRVLGTLVLEDGGWRHPWHVAPVYDERAKQWQAEIQPGFVNSSPATVRINGADIALTQRPLLPLDSFRSVTQNVPDFFQALGVGESPKLDVSGEEFLDLATLNLQPSTRRLASCDLVLYQDRIGTRTEWSEGAGIDGSFAQFAVVTTAKPNARKEAFVRVVSQWTLPAEAARQNLVRGDWTDSMTDELLLATVYLLSPPGASADSPVNGAWTPFVKHHTFWNLSHATNHLRPPLARLQLGLPIGLAGGFGDTISNVILAQVNDANSVASEFIGRQQIAGRFWTV